jgi:hypothetical protein
VLCEVGLVTYASAVMQHICHQSVVLPAIAMNSFYVAAFVTLCPLQSTVATALHTS